jgi:hypothetical protein
MARTTVAATTVRSTGHPITKEIGSTTSEILGTLKAAESHDLRAASACYEAATTLYVGIKRTSSKPFGLDVLVLARRMRRGMNRAAAAHEAAARSHRMTAQVLRSALGSSDQARKVRKTGIDLTK